MVWVVQESPFIFKPSDARLQKFGKMVIRSNDTKCAVGAPTDMASYNIGGVTVHRLFSLPIEHEGKTAGFWPLSKPTQKMCNQLSSLKLLIIDEVSMLSNLNLAYIHLRLEELFGGSG